MNDLLANAVQSIQLGVEDYQSNDPRRPLSAARNFLSGVLLLAKAALIKAAPSADPAILLAEKLTPVPDGKGGVKIQPASNATINYQTIGDRLKRFGISVDKVALGNLHDIRNDIEHRYTEKTGVAVKEALARAFPVVADLCRALDTTPPALLGETWSVMLSVKAVYDLELEKCVETFSAVDWPFKTLEMAKRPCPSCESYLIRQDQPTNTELVCMDVTCQSCDTATDGETYVEHLIDQIYGGDAHAAAMDGDEGPIYLCPDCSTDTYLLTAEYSGCVLCSEVLGTCARCECGLTPSNVSGDSNSLCGYCNNVMSKDD